MTISSQQSQHQELERVTTPIAITRLPGWPRDTRTLFLFPSEGSDGITFTQEQICALSISFSQLYQDLIIPVAQKFSHAFNIVPPASEIIVREAIVPLTHFYMDRLIRLNLLINQNPATRLCVVRPEPVPFPDSLDEFKSLAQASPAFNQNLLCHLARIWDFGIETSGAMTIGADELHEESRRSVNHNFDGSTLIQKAKRRFLLKFDKVMRLLSIRLRNRIPALSMAYATLPLANQGFYSSHLEDIGSRAVLGTAPRDHQLRTFVVYEAILASDGSISRFLDAVGIQDESLHQRITQTFAEYLVQAYPSGLLEAVPSNLKSCVNVLKPFNPKPLLNSETTNLESIYFLAAAKAQGMETIGVQHGGHYGYLDDLTSAIELEYGVFDHFITWGWRRFPEMEVCRKTQATPLPSPWLSERRRYWQRLFPNDSLYSGEREYDFLLMTNKIYRFPPAPSGAAVCRIDHIHSISQCLITLVKKSAIQGVRILHKPFNQDTAQYLERTFQELDRVGGRYYRSLNTLDKGLTKELLNQCHVVLWDQPGTGFLECLVSGIPTMVLWPRIYIQEVPWTREIFSEMESSGLIHREVDSLLAELKRFNASPETWMNDPLKKNVISRFTQEYSRVDDDWPAQWRKFLGSSLKDKHNG